MIGEREWWVGGGGVWVDEWWSRIYIIYIIYVLLYGFDFDVVMCGDNGWVAVTSVWGSCVCIPKPIFVDMFEDNINILYKIVIGSYLFYLWLFYAGVGSSNFLYILLWHNNIQSKLKITKSSVSSVNLKNSVKVYCEFQIW